MYITELEVCTTAVLHVLQWYVLYTTAKLVLCGTSAVYLTKLIMHTIAELVLLITTELVLYTSRN